MTQLRGEEQPGFAEILGNWLPQQTWFSAPRGRWRLVRVGGLRLPAPAGDPDSGVFLELHIFDVEHAESSADQPMRIAVPLALRSRPSSAVGKSAFIGRMKRNAHGASLAGGAEGPVADQDDELWVYDGSLDRAFLTAWVEMARRQQGSRNGRSRGEALGGFEQWPAFDLTIKRQSVDSLLPDSSRTVVTPGSAPEGDEAEVSVMVDFLRRPAEDPPEEIQSALTLTAARSSVVPRVLGLVSCAWEDREFSVGSALEWQSGLVGVIREAVTLSPSAHTLAVESLRSDTSFTQQARHLGEAVGTLHADLAGSSGKYPQSAEQLRTMASNAQQALTQQWSVVRGEFDEDEAADLNEVIDLMIMQLRDADERMVLQTIHGDLGAEMIHRVSDQRWIISEAGGMMHHAVGLRDVVTVLMSFADLVMQQASGGASPATDAEADSPESEEKASALEKPVNFGQWYEEVAAAVVEGYRSSEADSSSVDSVFFRAAMLAEALALFSRWKGRWVFRPSMLLQGEG